MGCGSVADFGHLPAMVQTPGLQPAALFDPNLEKAELLAKRHGVPLATNDSDKFFAAGLDAVAVTSSVAAHYDNVMAAAANGLHVLCEKPIAPDERLAHEMIAEMRRVRKLFTIGFCYRFSPVAMTIRDWVRAGLIGDVRSLRLHYVWNLHGRYMPGKDGVWEESPLWRGRMLEGGPIVDCGVHQIDLARWWLGREVVRTMGVGAWVVDDYTAPDHMYLHLDHEGGAHTCVEVSFTYGHTARDAASLFSYDLIGTGGTIRYDRDGWRLEARTGEGILRGPSASEKNFPGMYAAFRDAMHSGRLGDLPTPEDGLIATRLAQDGTEDAERRRVHPKVPIHRS